MLENSASVDPTRSRLDQPSRHDGGRPEGAKRGDAEERLRIGDAAGEVAGATRALLSDGLELVAATVRVRSQRMAPKLAAVPALVLGWLILLVSASAWGMRYWPIELVTLILALLHIGVGVVLLAWPTARSESGPSSSEGG